MRSLIFISCFIVFNGYVHAQDAFYKYFTGSSLRIDWVLGGDYEEQSAYLTRLVQQPKWGGVVRKLIDPFDFGMYKVILIDAESRDTIYSRGFSTLFEEWQTTEDARLVNRAFPQVVEVPYPRKEAIVEIFGRDNDMVFKSLLRFDIDPDSPDINRDEPIRNETRCLRRNGESGDCVDLTFIAEGYKSTEKEKFYKDVQKFADFLLSQQPFSEYADRFNVWAVALASIDSGTDDPGAGVWQNTALNSGFNTFQTDRYLETFDMFGIHNAAALVPHDHIIVMVNTPKYGGGGVYNHFSIVSADHPLSKIVFVHEFGHGFGGLGDEYYTSEVAYNNYINLTKEPWEPNLTTLVNFDQKWMFMVDRETPVPTPAKPQFKDSVGAFEGGGYVAKKVYRPALDCRMKTNEAPSYCKVCLHYLELMIQSLTR
jgi:hypothetical protein